MPHPILAGVERTRREGNGSDAAAGTEVISKSGAFANGNAEKPRNSTIFTDQKRVYTPSPHSGFEQTCFRPVPK